MTEDDAAIMAAAALGAAIGPLLFHLAYWAFMRVTGRL